MTTLCFIISLFDHFCIKIFIALRRGLLTLGHKLCYKLSDHFSYSYKFKSFGNNRIMFYFKTRKASRIYLISLSIMVSGKWIEGPKLHPPSTELFCGIHHKSTDICSNLDNKYIYYLSYKNSQICHVKILIYAQNNMFGLDGLICMTYNRVVLLSSYILL